MIGALNAGQGRVTHHLAKHYLPTLLTALSHLNTLYQTSLRKSIQGWWSYCPEVRLDPVLLISFAPLRSMWGKSCRVGIRPSKIVPNVAFITFAPSRLSQTACRPPIIQSISPLHNQSQVPNSTYPPPRIHASRITLTTMAPQIPEKQWAQVIEKTGGPVDYKQIPVQKPGPDEVLVNIKYSGVCHTDLHAVNGDWPLATKLPLVGGHEGAGVVVARGDLVKDVEIGDHAGVKV